MRNTCSASRAKVSFWLGIKAVVSSRHSVKTDWITWNHEAARGRLEGSPDKFWLVSLSWIFILRSGVLCTWLTRVRTLFKATSTAGTCMALLAACWRAAARQFTCGRWMAVNALGINPAGRSECSGAVEPVTAHRTVSRQSDMSRCNLRVRSSASWFWVNSSVAKYRLSTTHSLFTKWHATPR